MDHINASNDRVAVHQALKHLVVVGNALIYMHKDGLKTFPLNRYVVNRDGDGNVIEIVTKELIERKVGPDLPCLSPMLLEMKVLNKEQRRTMRGVHLRRVDEKSGRWVWHREAFDMILIAVAQHQKLLLVTPAVQYS